MPGFTLGNERSGHCPAVIKVPTVEKEPRLARAGPLRLPSMRVSATLVAPREGRERRCIDVCNHRPLFCAMPAKSSAVIDTRVISCGDNLDQLRKLPDGCVDLIYIAEPADRGQLILLRTGCLVDYMRPRFVELHRVLKKTGSL